MTTTMLDALAEESARLTEDAKLALILLQGVVTRSAALSQQMDRLLAGGERLVGGDAELISSFATVEDFAAFQARHFPYRAIQPKVPRQRDARQGAAAVPEEQADPGAGAAPDPVVPDMGEASWPAEVDVARRLLHYHGQGLQLTDIETAVVELLNRTGLPVTSERLVRYSRSESERDLRDDIIALNERLEVMGLIILEPTDRLYQLRPMPEGFTAKSGPRPWPDAADDASGSPKERALEIYAVENLTQKELAERVGCGLTTLQAWLTQARRSGDQRAAKGDLLRAEAKEAAGAGEAPRKGAVTLPETRSNDQEKAEADIAAAAGPLLKDGEVLSIDQNTCIVTRDTASIQLARHEMRMLRALNSGAPITLEDMMQALSVMTGRRVDSEVAKINPRIAQIGVLIVKNGAGEFQLSTDR